MRIRITVSLVLACLCGLFGPLPCRAGDATVELEHLMRVKTRQLHRFAEAYDAAIAVAYDAYGKELIGLMEADRPDRLRKSAAGEYRRFQSEQDVADEPDESLPPEIETARDMLRKARRAADQTRLVRTVRLLDAHLRELKRLLERAHHRDPDDPSVSAIRDEIEKTKRIRRHLIPASKGIL